MATKIKTHRGAAKRFKRTGTGKIKRRRAFRNHISTKKPGKRMRRLRTPSAQVSANDMRSVERMIGPA